MYKRRPPVRQKHKNPATIYSNINDSVFVCMDLVICVGTVCFAANAGKPHLQQKFSFCARIFPQFLHCIFDHRLSIIGFSLHLSRFSYRPKIFFLHRHLMQSYHLSVTCQKQDCASSTCNIHTSL